MEIIDNKCPGCSSNLEYNPKNKSWKCNFCGNEYKDKLIKKTENKKNTINELICPNCNAKLLEESNVISSKCIYCGNSVIVKKTNDKHSMPDKIIPFTLNKEMAIEKYNSVLSKKKLLPKTFSLKENIKEIKGVYIPFWLYSYKYKVNIVCQDPEKPSELNITTTKKTDVNLELIPYDANEHLDNKITKSIEPYNYEELIDFNTNYLSGFLAQKYDIPAEKGQKEVLLRCENTLSNIFNDPKSEHYIEDVTMINEKITQQSYNYALLPIWMLNINYENKNYFIIVNGQTGKVSGDFPIDKKKYNLIKILSFLGSFILISVIYNVARWLGIL